MSTETTRMNYLGNSALLSLVGDYINAGQTNEEIKESSKKEKKRRKHRHKSEAGENADDEKIGKERKKKKKDRSSKRSKKKHEKRDKVKSEAVNAQTYQNELTQLTNTAQGYFNIKPFIPTADEELHSSTSEADLFNPNARKLANQEAMGGKCSPQTIFSSLNHLQPESPTPAQTTNQRSAQSANKENKVIKSSLMKIKPRLKPISFDAESENSLAQVNPLKNSHKFIDYKREPYPNTQETLVDSANSLGKKINLYDNLYPSESPENSTMSSSEEPAAESTETIKTNSKNKTTNLNNDNARKELHRSPNTPKRVAVDIPTTSKLSKSSHRKTPITDRESQIASTYNPTYNASESVSVAATGIITNHKTQEVYTKGYKEIVDFLESKIVDRFGSLIPSGQADNPKYHVEPKDIARMLDSGSSDADPYEIRTLSRQTLHDFQALMKSCGDLRGFVPMELEPYLDPPVSYNSTLKVLRWWTDWELIILIIIFNAFLQKTGLRKRTLVEFLYFTFPEKGAKPGVLMEFSKLFYRFLPHRKQVSIYKKIETLFYPLSRIGEFTEEEDRIIIEALESGMRKSLIALSIGRTIPHVNMRIGVLQNQQTSRNSTRWTPEEDRQLLELVQKYSKEVCIGALRPIPFKKIAKEMGNRQHWSVRHRWVTRFGDIDDPRTTNLTPLVDSVEVKDESIGYQQIQFIQTLKKKYYKKFKDVDWEAVPKKYLKLDDGRFVFKMIKLIGSVKDIDSMNFVDALNFVQKQIIDNKKNKLRTQSKKQLLEKEIKIEEPPIHDFNESSTELLPGTSERVRYEGQAEETPKTYKKTASESQTKEHRKKPKKRRLEKTNKSALKEPERNN